MSREPPFSELADEILGIEVDHPARIGIDRPVTSTPSLKVPSPVIWSFSRGFHGLRVLEVSGFEG